MKSNEAIEYLENLQCHAATEGECDALGMAICSLRYTSTGEPLTLEQLQKMDGKPVWVEFTGSKIERESGWFILKYMKGQEAHLVGKVNTYKSYEYYGKTWVAYAYPPAHIDLEAQEPCDLCISGRLDKVGFDDRVYLCSGNCRPPENEKFRFCPKCGRALTEEAWVELKERLSGVN